jgi:hypothetical protein
MARRRAQVGRGRASALSGPSPGAEELPDDGGIVQRGDQPQPTPNPDSSSLRATAITHHRLRDHPQQPLGRGEPPATQRPPPRRELGLPARRAGDRVGARRARTDPRASCAPLIGTTALG